MLKKLCVFRHGETDWNKEGRFQGHVDIPLNETGRLQARALVPALREERIEAILTSDLARARETASIISGELRLPIISDAGLREAHLGQAQGLVRDEIEKLFGHEMVSRWKSTLPTDADVGYAGGETGSEVMGRVFGALERFLHSTEFERIGVSTHGGVIRRIFQKLLPPGSDPVPIPNGVLYVLLYDRKERRWRLSD